MTRDISRISMIRHKTANRKRNMSLSSCHGGKMNLSLQLLCLTHKKSNKRLIYTRNRSHGKRNVMRILMQITEKPPPKWLPFNRHAAQYRLDSIFATESVMTTVYFEDMVIGQTAEYGKTITEADIILSLALPATKKMHINEEYASATPFEGRIAHGMLTASLISTVLGTQLPGYGTVYLSQSAKFRAPVSIHDTVNVKVTIKTLIRQKTRHAGNQLLCKGKLILEGEAMVIAPSRTTEEATKGRKPVTTQIDSIWQKSATRFCRMQEEPILAASCT